MILNEDYFDKADLDNLDIPGDLDADDEYSTRNWEMQAQRPIAEILKDYMCYVNFELRIVDKDEQWVYNLCDRLKHSFDLLPGDVVTSPIIIGSRLSNSQFDSLSLEDNEKRGGFLYYLPYIMGQTMDDKGIQLCTQFYFGVRVDCGDKIDNTKALETVRTISNIIFGITKVEHITLINNKSNPKVSHKPLYDESYVNKGNSILRRIKEAMDCANVDVEPNWYPINCWMELLCTVCGKSYTTLKYNYEDFFREMEEYFSRRRMKITGANATLNYRNN